MIIGFLYTYGLHCMQNCLWINIKHIPNNFNNMACISFAKGVTCLIHLFNIQICYWCTQNQCGISSNLKRWWSKSCKYFALVQESEYLYDYNGRTAARGISLIIFILLGIYIYIWSKLNRLITLIWASYLMFDTYIYIN